MSRIIFAWEAGDGLGHIVPHIPLIRALQVSGHDIIFITKNFSKTVMILDTLGVKCFQAPLRSEPIHNAIKFPCTYAQILHNIGFDTPRMLLGMVTGWMDLLKELRPSLVILDHAPSALMACRILRCRALMIGSGFVIPPPVSPYPNLRAWNQIAPSVLEQDETQVLRVINRVLKHFNFRKLEALADLFDGIPVCLATYPELDPYKEWRKNAQYYGVGINGYGVMPQWPTHPGVKVFAYLKPSPFAMQILKFLSKIKCSAVVYVGEKYRYFAERFATSAMHFASQPVNLFNVASKSDVAILNGTHNSVAEMLICGIPILNHPLYLEQLITAKKVKSLCFGELIHNNHENFENFMNGLFFDNFRKFKKTVKQFSECHHYCADEYRIERIINLLHESVS